MDKIERVKRGKQWKGAVNGEFGGERGERLREALFEVLKDSLWDIVHFEWMNVLKLF